ncbi:ATP-binding protein [Blastococcus sp. CT_GayMR20]|uniref:two-component system sensor histidine kinase NtrB n=1 Tax=Blastococcus sp. CT_GayMR20 TaxID=2559609 RepID=UPI0014300B79|nr:ATP-binding protein [Blastococcus sp. CT_GayMR20]
MRANDVTTAVMLERPGGEEDRAAAPTGRRPHARERGELVAGYVMAMASVAIFLRVPTGSLWQVGACAGLLFASAALWAARASTLIRLRQRLDDADERLTAQSDELGRYAAILSSTEDAIVTVSLDGLVTHWNPAATELYGYAPHDALGRSFATLSPEAVPAIVEAVDGVMRGAPGSLEIAHRRGDGSTVHASLVLSLICDPDGEPTGVVGIARNIGEQKARDAEFHQESKLESLGRLSAGLAHEINSPIQFVGDNARFLEEAYQELIRVVEIYRGLLDTSNPIGWIERQERVRQAEAGIDFDYLQKEIPSAVEQTLEGIERVSTIVRAMKTFSHQGHKEQVPADLNEAVAATVTVTRHQVSEVAELVLDLADLPPVRCNIADLNQVFLNLIVNAADAIAETERRGVITVATALEGEDVVVRVSDTGAGIPDDVRPMIFDPFFTTKDVGRGSGQGLPLARGVVQEGHGGTLTVESVLGVGTTFSVRIPVEGLAEKKAVGAGASPTAAR